MDASLHRHLSAQERPVISLEGTRKLPAHRHGQLQALAAWLGTEFPRAIFRSGNAEGTDAVFADAVAACDPARLELVLPHAGMGRKRRPSGARCVALEAMPDADLERVVAVTREAGRDAGRLGDYYLTHRHGPGSAATSKATFLLRDTLKVTGAETLGLMRQCGDILCPRSRPHRRRHWPHDQGVRRAERSGGHAGGVGELGAGGGCGITR